jgi:hypothetical protein
VARAGRLCPLDWNYLVHPALCGHRSGARSSRSRPRLSGHRVAGTHKSGPSRPRHNAGARSTNWRSWAARTRRFATGAGFVDSVSARVLGVHRGSHPSLVGSDHYRADVSQIVVWLNGLSVAVHLRILPADIHAGSGQGWPCPSLVRLCDVPGGLVPSACSAARDHPRTDLVLEPRCSSNHRQEGSPSLPDPTPPTEPARLGKRRTICTAVSAEALRFCRMTRESAIGTVVPISPMTRHHAAATLHRLRRRPPIRGLRGPSR